MERSFVRLVLTILPIAAIPLLGIAGVRLLLQIEVPAMTRDVAAIGGLHPLAGVLSSLGILLWWTSAAVWLFSALLVRGRQGGTNLGFLVCSGLLSAYFAFDDLFQFHEFLAPQYLKLPERAVYGLLACATAAYAWRYRRTLMQPDGVLLLLAYALLAASVLVDTVLEPWYLVEDGLKWLGICFWTTFCIVRCRRACSALPEPGRAPAPSPSPPITAR